MLLLTHMAYFAVIILLATSVPQGALGSLEAAKNSIFILGFLGAWRYSWAALNFTRAIIFRRIVYPVRKARVFKRFRDDKIVSHCFFMVTTYGMEVPVTMQVYRKLFHAAANAKDGSTIVASVVDGSDERLIRKIFETMPRDMSSVRLVIDRIKSKGKRDAIAQALDILRSFSPTHRDICVFLDGDTVPPEDIHAKSAPWFTNPKIGALTTDEGALIERKNLYRDWFILRFNQRQVMMSSMGLSNHVLTLTGRMSVFRADLATNPEFIEGVDHDFIDHWRLGRVTFLTGDDKSTWYWLLRHGYEMAYLPDVRSWSFEAQPRDTFFDSAKTLMVRWFGNMMRTNGRALRLSPRKIGFFTWWSILDQRVSAWTTLVGPLSVAIAATFHTLTVIPLYIAWVMATRYIFCVIIALNRGTWFPITHPPILYFGQVVGASIKTFVMFRLNKQKWTRQTATEAAAVPKSDKQKAQESFIHHVLAIIWLTIGVLFLANI
ncbi:glycosyltransferase [Pseudoprimorskyibacter insulae]|uniref:Mannuronan synthase n=1 Tax=Pseudoprimorskyibacter insulae TaxID=1695997 RepID=A0A2R8API9_9RHOB|nr:glycosyltransferase [Pseudoprimorskyibacter insulae]SPF77986.1 Mannuronan synthase [Pseudoprimorskyibacter insulae]